MGTEIAENPNTEMAVPAELAAAFGGVETNMSGGEQAPHISIKGKVWKIVKEGSENPLMTTVDGEPTPMPTIKVVILNQIPKRSRVFFPKDYEEGTNVQPECWSINGDTPSSEVSEPVANTCSSCPNAIKGSKITENGQTTACGTNKRICVIPSNKPDATALLVKLPVTSLWESSPSEEAQGWYSYDNYLKYLKANGVAHTAMVVTTMKFDANVSYPKVMFKYNGYVDGGMATQIAGRVNSDEVTEVLGLNEPAFIDGVIEATKVVEEVVKTTPAVVEEENDGFGEEEPKAKKATPKKKTVKKKAKAKAAPAETEVETVADDDALSKVMSDWD